MGTALIVLTVANSAVALVTAVVILLRQTPVRASDASNPALLFLLTIAATVFLFGRPDQAFEVASTLAVGGSAALAAGGLTALARNFGSQGRTGTLMVCFAVGSYGLPLASAIVLAATVMD